MHACMPVCACACGQRQHLEVVVECWVVGRRDEHAVAGGADAVQQRLDDCAAARQARQLVGIYADALHACMPACAHERVALRARACSVVIGGRAAAEAEAAAAAAAWSVGLCHARLCFNGMMLLAVPIGLQGRSRVEQASKLWQRAVFPLWAYAAQLGLRSGGMCSRSRGGCNTQAQAQGTRDSCLHEGALQQARAQAAQALDSAHVLVAQQLQRQLAHLLQPRLQHVGRQREQE